MRTVWRWVVLVMAAGVLLQLYFVARIAAMVVIDPPRVLLAVGVAYALSGPAMVLWQRMRPPATS